MSAYSMLAPNFERIPQYLKDNAKWAVWNPEPREGGKVAKIPRRPTTGKPVSTTRVEEWATYDECRNAVEAGGFTGVGILLDGSGVVGIDIDHLREAMVEHPAIRTILQSAKARGGYIETSPGKNGVHALVRGVMEAGGRRAGPVEVYSRGRFLTVTGQEIGKLGGGIVEDQATIDAVLALIEAISGGRPAQAAQLPKVAQGGAKPAAKLDLHLVNEIAAEMEAAHPLLWAGRWNEVGKDGLSTAKPFPSHSEGDAALAGHIARAGARAGVAHESLPALVEAVFGQSGLSRIGIYRPLQSRRNQAS